MTISLRGRMVLTYSFFICVFILLMGSVINRFAAGLFQDFIRDSADDQSWQAAALIAEQYSPETGTFDIAALRLIAANHARQGLFITVEDASGAVLWCVRYDHPHHGRPMRGMGRRMGYGGEGGHMPMRGHGWRRTATGHDPVDMAHMDFFDDRIRSHVFPVTHNLQDIGRVTVQMQAPYFFNEIQFAFVNSLRQFLIWIEVVFGVLSVIIAAFLANALSKPILAATGAAKKMAGGDWSVRIPEGYRTREIGELSRSLNYLASALENGDKWQKQLTTDVAHELRTPLTTLQGTMEAMIDGVWEPTTERLACCHEEIMRLSRLVEDLGQLSMLEQKNIALSRASFDLLGLLSGIVEQFKPAAMEKGIAISLSGPQSPISADSDRLKQVFVNLLSNAVKYTDSGGISVTIACGAQAEYAVSVADTGIGIPRDELAHVFERFFRTDKSRSRVTGGAGIGLAIASSIVHAHEGRIEVSSESGHGSVFTVFLPKHLV
ncbi:MAG: ATP-binding protein [Treponema sp.]|nr:ATP-binding protein [Treponema sp.]